MTDQDILKYLEERAADCGIKDVRLVVENSKSMPCSAFCRLNDNRGATRAGFGNTIDEALDNLRKKLEENG